VGEVHEALAQYHLHPEEKFHNSDYLDHGVTHRRHIMAEYCISPEDADRILDYLRVACERLGQRAVAKAVRMSLRDISALIHGKRKPTSSMLIKLHWALPRLKATNRE
jgi:hypothetical protein